MHNFHELYVCLSMCNHFFFLHLRLIADLLVSLQAIETGLGYGEWLHGEAVAAGTVLL